MLSVVEAGRFGKKPSGFPLYLFVPPDCHRDAQKDAAAIPNANPNK
jgi:hypothetical protein